MRSASSWYGSFDVEANRYADRVTPDLGKLTSSDTVRKYPKAVAEHDGDYYWIDKY